MHGTTMEARPADGGHLVPCHCLIQPGVGSQVVMHADTHVLTLTLTTAAAAGADLRPMCSCRRRLPYRALGRPVLVAGAAGVVALAASAALKMAAVLMRATGDGAELVAGGAAPNCAAAASPAGGGTDVVPCDLAGGAGAHATTDAAVCSAALLGLLVLARLEVALEASSVTGVTGAGVLQLCAGVPGARPAGMLPAVAHWLLQLLAC